MNINDFSLLNSLVRLLENRYFLLRQNPIMVRSLFLSISRSDCSIEYVDGLYSKSLTSSRDIIAFKVTFCILTT
ncbi:hypothetical protein DICPUDRAFT_152704 [Dictyostelium purpureum]|uniref:Uncharacterized protein n=1 Tax=Dictyostelium purpureum TaxID=5786 RepID=F0ZM28_DICPU|nr:uncharacterized protein DICPUDRAFT_152704 [Dictyostelium purpureum]EGC34995.1 hypothetical protein DICPUDRAFT_152704 [Dictyostelium purpureum]|eukprot:XP_003288469.1 hypothetical protein DICPUDRAFT_152704 [Dictyostelium purpureum]